MTVPASVDQAEEEVVFNHRFFHMYQEFVLKGRLADLAGARLPVLLVIKCHCDFRTGIAAVRHEKIAELTGLKTRTVMKATRSMEDEGRLENLSVEIGVDNGKTKRVRTKKINRWRVKERFVFSSGENQREVVTNYVPLKMKRMLEAAAKKIGTLSTDVNVIVINVNGDFVLQKNEDGGRDD